MKAKPVICPLAESLSTLIEKAEKTNTGRTYYQQKRGTYSAIESAENIAILLAWNAAELTEGQASKALGVDRVTARDWKIRIAEFGERTALKRLVHFAKVRVEEQTA